MIDKIKRLIKGKKIIIENFSYLSVLHFFQLLIPLLIYPYLIRIVGANLYGEVIYAQTFVSYFLVFIKFGFDLYGTNQVAIHSENKHKLSEIVSVIYSIRFVFLVMSAVVLYLATTYIDVLKHISTLLWYCFLLNIGEFLFPMWFFLGVEKMKFITIINISSKVVYLLLVFTIINTAGDYLLIPLLFSISSIFGGLVSLYILIAMLDINFVKVSFNTLKSYIKKSTSYFINSLSILLVEKTNVILLGNFIGMKEVAYYDLANKIIQLAKTPFSVISNVLFPDFSKNLNPKKIKKALYALGSISLLAFGAINVFGGNIITILGGVEMLASKNVLALLSLVLPFVAISIVLGISLAAKGFSKEFMIADIIYLVTYLILVFSFYKLYELNIYTVSTAIVVGVILNTAYKFYQVKKYNLL